MRSGKSVALYYSYSTRQDKDRAVIFLPLATKGRYQDDALYCDLPIKYINSLEEAAEHITEQIKDVYIDEANLFESKTGIKVISDLLHQGHNVRVYGLRRDRDDVSYSKLTRWLLLFADFIEVMHGSRCDVPGCYKEGYNTLIEEGDTGEKNVVDRDDVVYKVYCEEHYTLKTECGGKHHE
jgi:thymidine kinase